VYFTAFYVYFTRLLSIDARLIKWDATRAAALWARRFEEQEAQLSQRGRAMLRVIKYFVRSLR